MSVDDDDNDEDEVAEIAARDAIDEEINS